jgi:glycosyltransferase involved in cell wall biosynthesis
MPWQLGDRLRFSHEVIGGVTLPGHRGDGTDYHLSPRILAALARSRPDAVVATGYSVPAAYAGIYCAITRTPLVIHSAGTSRSERELGSAQDIARRVLLHRAATCAAVSVPAAERFQELGVAPERIFLTTHTTDLEPHWGVGRERSYPERDVLRVLAVGRLIPRKGLDRLVRATAAAIESGTRLELRFVGTGPEEERLRRLAAELGISAAVRFDGFVDQTGLPGAYADADAFAFPTLRDPFGFVLLEAMATGLPAIASPDAGATHELIEHERSGLVVEPDDIAAMARTLAALAADRELRERLGRAAHDVTLRRTPDRSARGFLQAVEAARREPGRALA